MFAGLAIRERSGGMRSDSEAPERSGGPGRGFTSTGLLVTGFLNLAQQTLDNLLRVNPVAAGIVVGNNPMLQNRRRHLPNFPTRWSREAPKQRQRPGAENQTLRSARSGAPLDISP